MLKQTILAVLGIFASAAGGQVVFSEIHYHPVEEPVFNADGSPVLDLTDDVHEFIELQNTGAVAVEIGGWSLSGGVDFVIPAGAAIPAGGFKVIAKNPARIETVYSLVSGTVLGPFMGKLGNDGDTIRLRNAAGAIVEEVSYSGHFPWAESANALGAQDRFTGLSSAAYNYRGRSLQRVSKSASANDPANWLASPLTGPTPGAAQAVTRAVPKPVVIAQSRVQTSDGSFIIRAAQPVTVSAVFSSAAGLSRVQVEYFVDEVNSTAEPRSSVMMTAGENGVFTATLPEQEDRSIVRYRFRANRGEGLETVSPRGDDPQISPTGPGGALEAWHGWFVTPVRSSPNAIYDLFIGSAQLTQLATNITQEEPRVTSASAAGVPREVPWVPATAPLWNGTQPGIFACNGEIRDIHLRYHGSRYHRSPNNHSYKIHFPENQPFRGDTSFFITGHTSNTAEIQKMYRLLDLPSSLTRTVDWYLNAAALESRLEHGEYERHVLEEWTARQQQLNPGSAREETGEFYKAIGNINTSQSNLEGPYTKADEAPMLANSSWTQLQRYEWTFSLQNNAWKGHRPLRDLIEGMWVARGDTPALPALTGNATALARTRAWFQANFDIDATLTALAVCQWAGIWDDTGHNQFFWRRANGKWVRLPWDFDDTLSTFRASQSIYSNELGVSTFLGPNWWKDTFFKCFRNEFKQRLWELNNSFLDPSNLIANGLPVATGFAVSRQSNVNSQVALGAFNKPARPANEAPAAGAGIIGGAVLTGSAYSHPAGRPHTKSKWEIRLAAGDFEEPVVRTVSTVNLTTLPVPFEQLTWGQSYFWRVTYYDTEGHASIVSPETGFTWGTGEATAGTLVLNEILADNRTAAEHAGTHPDFIELRNNGEVPAFLEGHALTDDPLVPAKYVFPAGTTLAPGASLVVWCDSAVAAPGLHSGFGIDADGQTVLLLHGGTILDAVTFGPQAPDISIGRIVSGTGGWQANTPTPGTVNEAKELGSAEGLRFNEWMAAPAYGEDWLEIYNPSANPVAPGGLYLSDDPSLPASTRIPTLSFIAGGGYSKFTADGSSAGANRVNFKLAGGGDKLVLTAADGLTTLDLVTFGAQATGVSQGRLPDGGGTVVAFPESSSPASSNWLPGPVVINEALANSTAPFEDSVELHNPAAAPVSIGGWWLSDDRSRPQKYHIPPGTSIPAGGFFVFTEAQFNAGTNPFSLSSLGDEIVLSAVDGGGALTGYRAQVSFGPSAENVSFGRVAVAGGAEFWPQTGRTFGATNTSPAVGPLLINEIMYHPADGAGGADDAANEFIEVHNPGPALDVSGWRLKGDSDFTFPPAGSIAGGGYILVVGFDPSNAAALAAFRTRYSLTAAVPVFGPYSAKLSNSTQSVELARPGPPVGEEVPFINVDKVKYRDMAPWDAGADGTGFSLQRESRFSIGNDPDNWSAAAPTPGAANSAVLEVLTIYSESPLPGGVAGIPYSQNLSAGGGAPGYTWTVSSGTLPGGMVLAADGTLSGTAPVAGIYYFTAQVADTADATVTKALTLTIAATPLQITTASLPDGIYGTEYIHALSAGGGNPGYTWSLSAGALPDGLFLSNAGVVSGTPGVTGVFNFTVRATDTGSLTATRSYTLTVPVPPLTIGNAPQLPNAAAGVFYSQALLAAGGMVPYTWTVSSGALPGGLTLNSAGDLGGVPAVAGTFSFTVQLTDASATVRTKEFSLTVEPPPLVITSPAVLPGGIAGDAWSQTLTATGGTPPYAWTLTGGSLPTGVVLSSGGVLTGTPAVPGAFSFTVRNIDAGAQIAGKSFTITIAASGPLHHFSWDCVPLAANAGTPFAARLTARDLQGRLVSAFSGSVNLSAAGGVAPLPSPVVITEVTNEAEDQFEMQNISSVTVDTTGWFARIGDNSTGISVMNGLTVSLPDSLPPGGIVRVSESNTAGRTWFGGPIAWNTTVPHGWIMLFDSGGNLRDFFVLGWTAGEIATLSVTVNGRTITSTGQWQGDGAAQGVLGNVSNNTDSWQRSGTSDNNTVLDWAWKLNGATLDTTNTGLTLPWAPPVPVAMTPSTATLTNGEWLGWLTISQAGTAVRLTAASGAISGTSTAFDTAGALADTDGDGIPDTYESAHGLNPNADDTLLDADGDGSSNGAEFRFGTDPQAAASRPVITAASLEAGGMLAVTWPAAQGKLYRLAASRDGAPWEYTPVLATATGLKTALVSGEGAARLIVRVEAMP